MIIKIIKFFFVSLTWFFVFKQLNKNQYRGLFDNLNIQLLTLPQVDVYGFFTDLIFNKLTDISILNKIASPLGLNWKSLIETKNKRIFFRVVVLFYLIYRGFLIIKKIILLPFKLGVFSFIYSLIGIDMSWFLSLFNFFTLNIPQWVYFQYLLLYNNWLSWWYNTVKIKSLNTISLPKNSSKEVLNSNNSNLDEAENKFIINKTRFIIFLSVMTLIGVGVWYYFYSDFSGGGGNSSPNSATNSEGPQIEITDNSSSSSSRSQPDWRREGRLRLRAKLQASAERRALENSLNIEPLHPRPRLNRLDVLDRFDLSRTEGPPSPTGSDDSSETIRPSQTVRDVIYSVFPLTIIKK